MCVVLGRRFVLRLDAERHRRSWQRPAARQRQDSAQRNKDGGKQHAAAAAAAESNQTRAKAHRPPYDSATSTFVPGLIALVIAASAWRASSLSSGGDMRITPLDAPTVATTSCRDALWVVVRANVCEAGDLGVRLPRRHSVCAQAAPQADLALLPLPRQRLALALSLPFLPCCSVSLSPFRTCGSADSTSTISVATPALVTPRASVCDRRSLKP